MKTSFTQTQLIALGAAGAAAVIGLGSVVHAASVRHQNRLSYERQLEANQKNFTQNTLYTAGESLGQAIALAPAGAQNMKQWNDTYYAYRQTYGQAQYDKWASSPSVKPLLAADSNLRDEIQRLNDATQARNEAEALAAQRQFEQSMAQLQNFHF
jgi:hypothetical protein